MAPTSETRSKNSEGSAAKLRRRLAGDLDDIVLMSLRKEPDRRYASVEQFAEDIRNHLDGRPIIARKGSWNYRAAKFANRHKAGVAATAAVALAVAIGIWATVHEARIAAANERRAEQRFNDVRKLANSLMFEIHDAIRELPGSTSARRLLVTRALEYLDSLSAQSKGDVSLQKELAAAYERVGDVLGYPYAANLGDNDGALQSYRKALSIREPLAAVTPNDTDLNRELAGTYIRIAQVLAIDGKFSDALAALGKAQPIAERLAAGSKDPVLTDLFAGVYYFTAIIQSQIGDIAAALSNYQRSASIRDPALQANPGSFLLRAHLAADYAGVAKCFEQSHDLPHAIEMQSKAAAILEEVVKSHPENGTLSEYLGEGINRLATYRKEHGEAAAALETYTRAHEIFGKLRALDAKNTLAKSNVGFSNNGIGESLVAVGTPAEAVKVFRESIATFEDLSPKSSASRYPRTGLAQAYTGLGDAYSLLAAGKGIPADQKRQYWEEAGSACQKGLALWTDKEKRGEMESDEKAFSVKAAQCVAEAEARLSTLGRNRTGAR